jgi:Leucine-rich repeat (LRR) protein
MLRKIVLNLLFLISFSSLFLFLPAKISAQDFSCNDVSEIPQQECEALVSLYNSTNGANWSNNTGWLATDTPCSWFGLQCNLGHITVLSLGQNSLNGNIPSEIGNLTEITAIELWSDQLTGSIPIQFGNLTDLVWLRLDGNSLTGSIPSEFGNLQALQYIFMGNNQLSGSIPPELGNLTNLYALELWYNNLSGSIPAQLGNLTKLQRILLTQNQLSGNIPPELGNLVSLEYLWLGHNQLSGSIPVELGNMINLQAVELWSNHLSGVIPFQLGNWTKITWFRLDGNQLSGNIPSEIGNLTSLVRLYLNDNALQGEVPSNITNLINLEGITLEYNMLKADNQQTADFLNQKDSGWEETQTVPPKNLTVSAVDIDSVLLSWTPISYTGDEGYYIIYSAITPGGPYQQIGTTIDKFVSSFQIDGILPGQTYYFVVRSYTPAHNNQQNELLSSVSSEVSYGVVAFNPAEVWVGLKNSYDFGIKFDLMAEVYKGSEIIGSGQLDSVLSGGIGFYNARLNSIPLTLTTPTSLQSGDQLKLKVYVRNACSGSWKNSGTARLWYNDSAANSHFGTTLDSVITDYYLLNNYLLGINPGSGPKRTIDVGAGYRCSPFKSFGTWTITL